jgi:hypothetical protein
MIQTILIIILLILSFPLSYLLYNLTKDEKKIYYKYFPPLLWILAILAAIFFTFNIQIAIILTFLFLIVFFWDRFSN